ncbi:MAG TPA: M48 family metalloprotease [Gammaproteobacteria bacterium]
MRGVATAVVVGAVAALGGCAINPVTGERELALLSEEQEIALGRESAEQVARAMAGVENAELEGYVAEIGGGLAATSERPDLPWQFGIVDDPTPNAFALPGGFIFVTRGLLGLLRSEAELAAVLGHEIGHVTARHSVTQISRQQLAQLGLGIGMAVSPELARLGDLAGAGLNLLFLKHGRDDERQADELGFRYMLEQGYDVREMDDVFVALEAAGELAGQSPLPTWLASHPSEPERIAAVQERIASLPQGQTGGRVEAERYLRAIDGLTYGEDPRNGYFDDGMFYHPELAFQFAVPADWRRQNLASVVVAASEAGDAALELSIVANATPEQATQRFASERSVELLGSSEERLNGNRAIVSRFRAAAQNGVVAGYVAHIDHGGATYRLVAYAPESRIQARAPLLEDIVESFAPLRDPERLEVEPRRIAIVALEEAMTFEEFTRRYPSTVAAEELAVLNHVQDPGAELAPGTLLKRVVGGPGRGGGPGASEGRR